MAPLIRYLPHSPFRPFGLVFLFSLSSCFYPFLGCIGISSIFIAASLAHLKYSIFTQSERGKCFFSVFPDAALSLPLPLLLSNALRDAFPAGQCWKLITLQLDFLPSHKWKWMQLVAGIKVVLPVLSSSSSSRQLVCPLPQPMWAQLTQLFN